MSQQVEYNKLTHSRHHTTSFQLQLIEITSSCLYLYTVNVYMSAHTLVCVLLCNLHLQASYFRV